MNIQLKRAYEEPAESDGLRILVDRLWPRGVSKEKLRIDEWLKEIAPSTKLRKWFGHDAAKWREFVARYRGELRSHRSELARIRSKARARPVTLVFAARDEQHNHAIVLRQVLERE